MGYSAHIPGLLTFVSFIFCFVFVYVFVFCHMCIVLVIMYFLGYSLYKLADDRNKVGYFMRLLSAPFLGSLLSSCTNLTIVETGSYVTP